MSVLKLSDLTISELNDFIEKGCRKIRQNTESKPSFSASSLCRLNPMNCGEPHIETSWTKLHGVNHLNSKELAVRNAKNRVTQKDIIRLGQRNVGSDQYIQTPQDSFQTSKSMNYKNPNQSSNSVDPYYYSKVSMSRLASQQILNHAVRGGTLEIMGILVGFASSNNFIVTRTFELPILGTETRVNAQSESYEYMVRYVNNIIDQDGGVPGSEKVVGWYHSHPGYGCWLSGIDMRTQDLNQSFQDPYLAIVVDPLKSVRDKRISIGAFRTVKKGNGEELSFYPLDITIFDSDLNRCIDEMKLKFNFDIDINNKREESVLKLTQALLENMKHSRNMKGLQSETIEDTMDESSSINNKNNNNNNNSALNFQQCKDEKGTNSSNDGNTLNRNDIIAMIPFKKKSPYESMVSINSMLNNSDSEFMHSETDIDMESINSSIYYGTAPMLMENEPPQHISVKRQDSYQQHFHPQQEDRTQTRVIDETKVTSGNNKNISNDNNTVIDITKNEHTRSSSTIERDHECIPYVTTKQAILTLKLQEYRSLRVFKDVFTL